ncbi:unnamed protein product [Choristocarpus tenellus]
MVSHQRHHTKSRLACRCKIDTAIITLFVITQTIFMGCNSFLFPCPGMDNTVRKTCFRTVAGPTKDRVYLLKAADEADRAGTGPGERGGYYRKPKGNNLRRDEFGMPVEKVYAPRPSHYPIPKKGGTGGSKRIRPQGEKREASANNPSKLRVAGGSARGRKLESPDVFLRPMMGKVKEALFSTLTGFGVFEDEKCRVRKKIIKEVVERGE